MSDLTSARSGRPHYSRAVHRLAILLTATVFPLIWVGGLVTTYDAGMAVPDWPGTYGENMFTYQAWLFGPFDLMVEHGHRLLGSFAGLISIGLVVAAFWKDPRTWFRWWTVLVLLSVIAQGVLGGARVLLDQRTAAMIHGCTGPLFFAMATATAVMSSRWWCSWTGSTQESGVGQYATGRAVAWLASLLAVLAYAQLVAGAQLRHVTGLTSTSTFQGFVHAHLGLAGLVFLVAAILALWTLFSRKIIGNIKRVCGFLAIAVVCQIALGIGTWIVNYALPWPEVNETLAAYTILAKGYWESMIVTAHMATGSLIISLGTVAALRCWRTRSLLSS